MNPLQKITEIQSKTSLPDKIMASLIGISVNTYRKCKSEKEERNVFNVNNVNNLKQNLKKFLQERMNEL